MKREQASAVRCRMCEAKFGGGGALRFEDELRDAKTADRRAARFFLEPEFAWVVREGLPIDGDAHVVSVTVSVRALPAITSSRSAMAFLR